MIKSFSFKKLVERLQQVFPSQLVNPAQKIVALLRKIPAPMLLLAVAAHGLLLFIPFSSSVKQKSQESLSKQQGQNSLELVPTPPSTQLFNPETSLVKEKKPVESSTNPLIVSQLPPIPTGTSTNITLPPTTSNLQPPPPPPSTLRTNINLDTNLPVISEPPVVQVNQTPPSPPARGTIDTSPTSAAPSRVRVTSKPRKNKKRPNSASTAPATSTAEKPDSNTTEVTSISTGELPTPEANTDNSNAAATDVKPNPDNSNVTASDGDLPKYTNTKVGSFGLLPGDLDKQGLQTTDKLADVVNFYEKELATSGYEVKAVRSDKNVKIYQVSKGTEIKFLHLFEQEGKGTVIIFTDKEIDVKTLNGSQSISAQDISASEKEFDTTLDSIKDSLSLKEKTNFAEPDKFASTVPGIKKILGTSVDKKPEELAKSFTSKLETQGFKISPVKSDGGALLYEVNKGDFTQFINFVPTADNKGTNVVVWEKEVRS